MAVAREREPGPAPQRIGFKSGNEMAALAAKQIDYHLMGYYPITPSTEIAELLDEMRAEGEHRIVMVPADGEHGAAGICYGGSVGGGRVFNATSANGYLYALEQMPVQSGTRFPMVLDLVTRSVSGPLDIRGDHSDLYFALNTGWIILLARDPQAVYDMNIMAVRIGEHPEVRVRFVVDLCHGHLTSSFSVPARRRRAATGSPRIPSWWTIHSRYSFSVGNRARRSSGQSSDQAGNVEPSTAARDATSGRLAHHTWRRFGGGCCPVEFSRRLSTPISAIGSHPSISTRGLSLFTATSVTRRPCAYSSRRRPDGRCTRPISVLHPAAPSL